MKKNTSENMTDMKKMRAEAYNNKHWRNLRDTYLREHAVCQECLKKQKLTPATDVHHIKSPFSRGQIDYDLLLSPLNLESVCKQCHQLLHNAGPNYKSPAEIIKILDELFEDVED